MRSSTPRRPLLYFAILLLAAGCTRGVSVESEPGPAYALEVENPMPHPMIVSYNDGTGTRLLGTVPPTGSARFIITRPASRQITVTATDEGRTRTITRSVYLRAGEPTTVEL